MMKNGFSAYFKSALFENLRVVLIVVFVSAFVFVPMLSDWQTHSFFHYVVRDNGYVDKIYEGSVMANQIPEGALKGFDTNFGIAVALVIFLSLVVPIFNFAKFKNRRNLDTLYSLPLSRRKFALAHYLSGLIAVLVPTAIGFLVEVGVIIGYGAFSFIDLGWLFVYFLLLMITGWLFYSMNLFVFNEANHIFDGVVFVICWNLLFYVVAFPSNLLSSFFDELATPFGYIMEILSRTEAVIETTPFYLDWYFGFETVIAFTLLWATLGLISVVLFFARCNKQSPERVGGISDSFFGYKLFIPLYVAPVVLFSHIGHGIRSIGDVAVFFSLAFVGYIIFRRGFKFKLSDYCTFGALVLFAIIKAAICHFDIYHFLH
ncbi:MAG: hypothetical protein IKU30_08640 [Clostridia bacterium]|nr:hypothetical protein [Clostridia bacterium]